MVTIRAFVSVERSPASVVLPLPGGPHRTMLGRWPDWVSWRSTSTTRRWPTRSSNFFGRIRVASGGAGRTPASFGKSSPWSIPDRILNSTDTMPPSEDLLVLGSDIGEQEQYCHVCGHSQSDTSSSPLFGVVDPVTGIWNQKFAEALIGQEANRAVRYHRPLSLLV